MHVAEGPSPPATDRRPQLPGYPDNETAEFAIGVRSELKGQGLGAALLDKLIAYCRDRGTQELAGQVLANNQPMLGLAKSRGFRRYPCDSDDTVEVRLELKA